MDTAPKQSRFATLKTVARKYERPALITVTVVSTTAAVLMRTGIAQHNAFLKEHGLFEQFYDLTPEA